MNKLLTVGEAATELRISRSQVYELLKRGELRALSIGKSRRITPSELDQFIAKKAEISAEAVAV